MSIRVEALTKQYGSQKAVDEVSFEIGSRQIVGLLGPNGAGKTTTLRIIAGFITDFEGAAEVEGHDVRKEPRTLKQLIGYLPEHNPLYLDMYVKEYLKFMGRLHQLPDLAKQVQSVIHATGLEREQHKTLRALSKGYRQRVGLAQAMLHDPKVLILDEPTSGLDPNQLIEIRQLIKDVAQEKTIIFSSHIMQEIQALCDRVIILNQGRKVADDRIDLLNQTVNQQRVIMIELDRPWTGKWRLPGLVKSESTADGMLRLTFEKSDVDPRPLIFDFVVAQERKLLSMQERKSNIEDVFQQVTLS